MVQASKAGWISVRVRSAGFWGLAVAMLGWHTWITRPEIERKYAATVAAQQEASLKIRNGTFVHSSRCIDGTGSDSRGQGTCSWHGGVDYAYYRDKESAYALLRARPYADMQSAMMAADKLLLWAILALFVTAPFWDGILSIALCAKCRR